MLLTALFGAALSLLLIACTNLASLLLARVLGRRGELAVRTALGAGRERLVRQLLTESLLLSMLGGTIGVLIAIAAVPLLARLVPLTLPIGEPTAINVRVLLFSALVTGATGVGFGVIPALRVSRRPDCRTCGRHLVRRQYAASDSGPSWSWPRSRRRLRWSSAGLLVRALWRIQAVDPGFRTADVLAVQTPVPWPKYASTAQRTAFYDRVVSQVRRSQGSSTRRISFVPMVMGGGSGRWFSRLELALRRIPTGLQSQRPLRHSRVLLHSMCRFGWVATSAKRIRFPRRSCRRQRVLRPALLARRRSNRPPLHDCPSRADGGRRGR
jgi:hypothetical protein